MIRRLAMAWAALGALAWAVPADGQSPTDPRALPDRSALERVGLERAWFTAVPLRSGLEQVDHLSLTADGSQIFIQTTEALLYCFDAETGRPVWSASLGPASGLAQDIGTNSTLAFATNGNYLYALDRGTGRQVWVERMETNASSPVAATEELVLLGLENGKLIAFSLVPAEDERFQKQTGAPGGFAWNFSTTGPITAEPIPTQFVVAFASNGGNLYATLLDPPKVLHRSQPIGPLYASMGTFGTGTDSRLMVPSMDRNLYCVDLFTGEQRWVFPTGAPIAAQPLVGGGDVIVTRRVPRRQTRTVIGTDLRPFEQEYTEVVEEQETLPMPPSVYVLNEGGLLFAVDPTTGEADPNWSETIPIPGTEEERVDPRTGRRYPIPGTARLVINPETGEPERRPKGVQTGAEQILALSPTRIYLQTEYGDLAIVERQTGELIAGPSDTFMRAGLDLRNYTLTTTNDIHDRLYQASANGSVICLREIGSSTPIPIRAATETPFGFLRSEDGAELETPPSIPEPPAAGDPVEENPFGFGSLPVRAGSGE